MRRILAGILFLTFYLNVNGRILIEKISLHQYQPAELDHAKIARTLVYRSGKLWSNFLIYFLTNFFLDRLGFNGNTINSSSNSWIPDG